MEDAILKEVWAAKDRIAARYAGDVDRYLKDMKRAQAKSPLRRPEPPRTARKTA